MSDEDIELRWQEFVSLLRSTKRKNIENVIEWLENNSDFKTAPASTRYHLNCKGGLLEHSLNVYHCFTRDFSSYIKLLEIPEDTVIITTLLHDLCKANTYVTEMRNVKKNNEWVQEPYYKTDDLFPFGHGEKSVALIYNRDVKLSALEAMMIRWHMGFSDRMPYDVTASDAFTKYPQVLLLNCADILSTYFIEGNTEGTDKYSQCGYKDLFVGRSALESLDMLAKKNAANSKINIDGFEYELAPADAEVDNQNVIYVNNGLTQVKVYAPHKDGLPF